MEGRSELGQMRGYSLTSSLLEELGTAEAGAQPRLWSRDSGQRAEPECRFPALYPSFSGNPSKSKPVTESHGHWHQSMLLRDKENSETGLKTSANRLLK